MELALVERALNRVRGSYTGAKSMPVNPLGSSPRPAVQHPSDPRPDLTEDAREWSAVLRAAWAMYQGDNKLYGLLHGLRCAGAQIKTSKGRLKLDYLPLIDDGTWTKEELVTQWLRPMQQLIAVAFKRAEGELAGLLPGQILPEWARGA